MRLVHLYWRLTGQHAKSAAVGKLCEQHDLTYYNGGSAVDRVVADFILCRAVAELGSPLLARFMIMGLGPGGPPWWPFPWRWRFGERWPKGYERKEKT